MKEIVQKKDLKFSEIKGFAIIFICFFISVVALSFFMLHRDTIYNGVEVEGIDMGGLTVAEGRKKLEGYFNKEKIGGNIQFVYGERLWDISSQEIDFSYDYARGLKEAYEIGRKGNYFKRIGKVISLYKTPHTIQLRPIYDAEKLDNILAQVKKEIDRPPKDAQISRQGRGFVITDEQIGYKLDLEQIKGQVAKDIKKLKYAKDIKLGLPVDILSPKITSESLSAIEDLLGSYTTKFTTGNPQRVQNIRLAAKAINGTVLMPREVFSFNDVVGPRTKDKGYQDAPVILQGEMVDGLGGGVCQVSSTLYNAALLSGAKVVQRAKHSIPSTYVPKGRDATVSYGAIDFKFENSFANPIYLEGYVSGNTLNINIYGKREGNRRVKIHSVEDEVIKRSVDIKYDPSMPQGQEKIQQRGRDGYKITTYKIIYENDVEISRERISSDYYKPQTQIIVKGTKKIATQAPKPQQDSIPDSIEEEQPTETE